MERGKVAERFGTGTAMLAAAFLLAPGCTGGAGEGYGSEDDDEYYYDDEEDDGDFIDFAADVATIVHAFRDDDHDGGGGRGSRRNRRRHGVVARNDLVRDPASGDTDDRGFLEARTSPSASVLRIRLEGLEPWQPVEAFEEDSFGVSVQRASTSAARDGRVGLVIPSGIVAGHRVEIRTVAGRAILRGRVPAPGREARDRLARAASRDDETGIRAVATLRKSGGDGHREARVDLRNLAPGTEAVVLVENGTGTMVPAGGVTTLEDGSARLRFDSRRGDPLPGGAEALSALAGRRFEVRIGADTVLEGAFPAF